MASASIADTHLGLCVERTLQAAHVQVDFHAKNVPVDFLSSKMLGENAHHALVHVPLRIPHQPEMDAGFVVDTGFTGFLTLPPAMVSALNLPFLRRIPAHLADGSTIFLSVYSATIVWDRAPRDVEVLATTGRQPLLGTLLLDGYTLTVDFEDGGTVTIDPL